MGKVQAFVILVGIRVFVTHAMDTEPLCLSRYDYDYKMLQKTFALEQEQKELRQLVDKQGERIAGMEAELKGEIKRLVQRVHDVGGKGSTYVRWGRTSCPENGTETVYIGYVAGSHYTHSGAAANYLCLPSDPVWGEFDDSDNGHNELCGAEYELFGTYSEKFFNKVLGQNDVPCSVCLSSRTSQLMIPARTACYDGWNVEYIGYLVAGHYSETAATEFVCLDSDPETLVGGERDENGKLLYMVEGSCGSLKCPPYVQNRELACVVCTK